MLVAKNKTVTRTQSMDSIYLSVMSLREAITCLHFFCTLFFFVVFPMVGLFFLSTMELQWEDGKVDGIKQHKDSCFEQDVKTYLNVTLQIANFTLQRLKLQLKGFNFSFPILQFNVESWTLAWAFFLYTIGSNIGEQSRPSDEISFWHKASTTWKPRTRYLVFCWTLTHTKIWQEKVPL